MARRGLFGGVPVGGGGVGGFFLSSEGVNVRETMLRRRLGMDVCALERGLSRFPARSALDTELFLVEGGKTFCGYR